MRIRPVLGFLNDPFTLEVRCPFFLKPVGNFFLANRIIWAMSSEEYWVVIRVRNLKVCTRQ